MINVNQPPVASAGPYVTARVLDRVQLDGSSSTDPHGERLTYVVLGTAASGSIAELSDAGG